MASLLERGESRTRGYFHCQQVGAHICDTHSEYKELDLQQMLTLTTHPSPHYQIYMVECHILLYYRILEFVSTTGPRKSVVFHVVGHRLPRAMVSHLSQVK